MFDILSYIIGKKSGENNVAVISDDYTFHDDGEGNITVEEVDNNGE